MILCCAEKKSIAQIKSNSFCMGMRIQWGANSTTYDNVYKYLILCVCVCFVFSFPFSISTQVASDVRSTWHPKSYRDECMERDAISGVPALCCTFCCRVVYHFWALANAYKTLSAEVVLWYVVVNLISLRTAQSHFIFVPAWNHQPLVLTTIIDRIILPFPLYHSLALFLFRTFFPLLFCSQQ